MNPDDKLRIANEIAIRRGFEAHHVSAASPVHHYNEEDTCDACDTPLTDRCYGTRTSYEYDEWSYYCSMACASGIHGVGDRAFFLECMGWTLWHSENLGDEFRWAKIADADMESPNFMKIVAREGDATWEADLLIVHDMMSEFQKMIGAATPAIPHDEFWKLRSLTSFAT